MNTVELRDNLIGRIERQADPEDRGTCEAQLLAVAVINGCLAETADYRCPLFEWQQYFFLLGLASEAMARLQMHPELAPRFSEAFGGENYTGDRKRLDLLVSSQIVQLLSPIEWRTHRAQSTENPRDSWAATPISEPRAVRGDQDG